MPFFHDSGSVFNRCPWLNGHNQPVALLGDGMGAAWLFHNAQAVTLVEVVKNLATDVLAKRPYRPAKSRKRSTAWNITEISV